MCGAVLFNTPPPPSLPLLLFHAHIRFSFHASVVTHSSVNFYAYEFLHGFHTYTCLFFAFISRQKREWWAAP